MGTEKASHIATVAATVLAAIGLGVTGYYASKAQETSTEALRISRDSLALSQELALKGLASRFFFGEAPDSLQTAGAGPVRAVINANAVDLYQVWVQGTSAGKPAVVKIWTIQACTGYTLPGFPFVPQGVHFSDGSTSWYRSETGALYKETDAPIPTYKGINPPRTFGAQACS